jgi:hypothetical protein
MLETVLAIGGTVAGLALAVLLIGWLWNRSNAGDVSRARRALERQRPALHQELFHRATASGRPRGLRWKSCDFDASAVLARDQVSGQILAFVGVTISFEAVAGGPMEDVEAVGNLRAGTAVFTYARGKWASDGRVLFNLDPQDAMRRYEGRIEPLTPLCDAPAATRPAD